MKLVPPKERQISWEEARWRAAYAGMDDRARHLYLAVIEGAAKRNPRELTPMLRLVTGSPK